MRRLSDSAPWPFRAHAPFLAFASRLRDLRPQRIAEPSPTIRSRARGIRFVAFPQDFPAWHTLTRQPPQLSGGSCRGTFSATPVVSMPCRQSHERPACASRRVAVAVLALISGCSDSASSGGAGEADASSSSDARLSEASCQELEGSAGELVRSVQECETDADCIVISSEAPCLVPFLCSIVVSARADRESFEEQAIALGEAYFDGCRSCAMANCVPPDALSVACSTSTKLCEIQ